MHPELTQWWPPQEKHITIFHLHHAKNIQMVFHPYVTKWLSYEHLNYNTIVAHFDLLIIGNDLHKKAHGLWHSWKDPLWHYFLALFAVFYLQNLITYSWTKHIEMLWGLFSLDQFTHILVSSIWHITMPRYYILGTTLTAISLLQGTTFLGIFSKKK